MTTALPSPYRDTSQRLDLPDGIGFDGDAAAVGVGADGEVFVFNRGSQRVVILDREGRYLGGWGDAERFARPHGLTIAADGTLLLVDAGSHTVERTTRDGELLLRLGTPGRSSDPYSGLPFNQPTDVAEHPVTRDLFISDGYGNSRIHHFDATGQLVRSWGTPGTGAQNLSNPHGLCFVDDDHLAVCDRENYRIQFFTVQGDLVDSWHWHHPSSIRRGPDGLLYIAELGPPAYMHGIAPDMGCCVAVVTTEGKVLERLGAALPGTSTGSLLAPHGLAISAEGDVYISEVNTVYLKALGRERPPADVSCLRRWSRP